MAHAESGRGVGGRVHAVLRIDDCVRIVLSARRAARERSANMIRRLFVHARLGELPVGARVITYGLLGIWTLVVLFPLYWMAITSFKLPIDVSSGPAYIPFVDFKPSLDAWHYIFVDLGPDTYRPYVNSLVIATCSTAVAVFMGSMAAYALARIEYRPPVAAVGLGVLMLAGVVPRAGLGRVGLRHARRR